MHQCRLINCKKRDNEGGVQELGPRAGGKSVHPAQFSCERSPIREFCFLETSKEYIHSTKNISKYGRVEKGRK